LPLSDSESDAGTNGNAHDDAFFELCAWNPVASRPLSVTEERVAECEAVLQRGLATFIEVGAALLRIRDGRLYRDTHKTFRRVLPPAMRLWAELRQ
jgi:hypothetical protein